MEEGALEEAAGVWVFFTSGEKWAASQGNGALYGAAWLPVRLSSRSWGGGGAHRKDW